jgi:hypothetical protein
MSRGLDSRDFGEKKAVICQKELKKGIAARNLKNWTEFISKKIKQQQQKKIAQCL